MRRHISLLLTFLCVTMAPTWAHSENTANYTGGEVYDRPEVEIDRSVYEDYTPKAQTPPASAPVPAREQPEIPQQLETENIVENQIIRGISLGFFGNQITLSADSIQKLTDLVIPLLKTTPKGHLLITAYATPTDGKEASALRISLSRALAIREALMALNIPEERVTLKALGSQTPISPLDRADLAILSPK